MTQPVKAAAVANRGRVDYNLAVQRIASNKLKQYVFLVIAGALVIPLGGASCGKSSAKPETDPAGAIKAMDDAEAVNGLDPAAGPKDPIPGVDLVKLDDKKKARFDAMVDSLKSPCGAATSLRKSAMADSDCKRGTFAAKMVAALLEDEVDDSEIREIYNGKYDAKRVKREFKNDKAPHLGPVDAPVKLVEFFDYGCPACKAFNPILKDTLADFPNDAVLFFKMYPLPGHPDSRPAAQAALAAFSQGKFMEIHQRLYDQAPSHKRADLDKLAKEIGLDMAKFAADFGPVEAQVNLDLAEGDNADVQGTPTLFVNGFEYVGPAHPRYLKLWIEEELAVNR